MSKKTRTFGERRIHVATRTVNVADISRDTRFQFREGDNPYIRGQDIAKSVRDCGAERFRDNIIVAEIDGVFYVADGFGRLAAAAILKWDRLEVDVIVGRNPAEAAHFVGLAANLGQVSQKGNTRRELAAIAYRQHTEEGLSYETIATMHGTSTPVVAQRVMRGNAIVAELDQKTDPAVVRIFACQGAAKTAAVDVLKTALKLPSSTYDEVCQALEERYRTTLYLLVGNNEKQVYRLLYDALDRARRGKHPNYLVLFYLATPGNDTGAGHRMLAAVSDLAEHYAPDACSFHGEDLSNDAAACNSRAVAQYLQACRTANLREAVSAA